MLSTADGVCPSALSRIVIGRVDFADLHGHVAFLQQRPSTPITAHLPAEHEYAAKLEFTRH